MRVASAVLLTLTLAACAAPDSRPIAAPPSSPLPASTAGPTPEPTATPPGRPDWLGTRVLPLRPDGLGEPQPTPPELRDRRLPTIDVLPPPPDDAFHSSITAMPAEVVARSTWSAQCPVRLEELSYLTLSFWGFDGRPHTGELIVHTSVAHPVRDAFARLHELRFPIEEMRVTAAEELDAPPTGDGNNTNGFVCRPVAGGTSWSEHARGMAVDVNPFHNPYVRRDIVVPELASAYVDRSWQRSGMIAPEVVAAFKAAGFRWGGDWSSSKDWMHFSVSGR